MTHESSLSTVEIKWRNKVVGKERWEGRKNIIDMHG
jgi:hypothetical protein